MMSPSCDIGVGVQIDGCAQGVQYLTLGTSGMNFDDVTFRKRALSLHDWLDADGEHSTSDYTPDGLSSLGAVLDLLARDVIIHPTVCTGIEGAVKRRCDHELEGDTSEKCKVCLQRTHLF